MNILNLRLMHIAATFVLLGALIACNENTNTPQGEPREMELSLATENCDVTLSGADEGKVFTIKSNIAAPKNILIKLVTTASSPDLCYFLTDEVTLPMGGYETKGKIIFNSKAVENLGSEVNIDVNVKCEGILTDPTPLSYKVKYTSKEKPVEEDITVSVQSKATEVIKIDGMDVSSEIEVSIDKKASKDIVIDLFASNALTSRYTLSDDQVIIKAGETSAKTSVIFHNADFIYTSSKADVKISIGCKTAKIDAKASSVIVSATGTTAITIPSSTMSAYNNTTENINLSDGNKKVRMSIWNIEETAEDMVFIFEVVGAEYEKEYTTNFKVPTPTTVRVPKYSGIGTLGAIDLYVEFLASAFPAGTCQVSIKGTILSGPARFGNKETDITTEIIVNITKIKK